MKMDRRHLIASLILLVLAVGYNIWLYTRPSGVNMARPISSASEPDMPAAAARGNAEAVDPMQVPARPDVALDRLPEWPRDPFTNLRREPDAVDATAAAPEPEPEADPVVASILYSESRRLAMINGRIARVGDEIGSERVVDILPNAVVVESPSKGRRTLPLRVPFTPVERP